MVRYPLATVCDFSGRMPGLLNGMPPATSNTGNSVVGNLYVCGDATFTGAVNMGSDSAMSLGLFNAQDIEPAPGDGSLVGRRLTAWSDHYEPTPGTPVLLPSSYTTDFYDSDPSSLTFGTYLVSADAVHSVRATVTVQTETPGGILVLRLMRIPLGIELTAPIPVLEVTQPGPAFMGVPVTLVLATEPFLFETDRVYLEVMHDSPDPAHVLAASPYTGSPVTSWSIARSPVGIPPTASQVPVPE